MKIAVVGCLHGKLNQIYEDVKECEKMQGFLIDVVIVCGDFQAIRNENDLKCMAVPDRYKELGDFHEYYIGKRQATHLTLVIGGNHEASNYFQTLPYGGWIAYNIYYMGYSSVVKLNGVRIGGISGIYNKHSVFKGHYEYLPYNQSTMRTAYYTRYLEIFRMLQLKDKLDVIFTHDWPLHIYKQPGAREYLLKRKKHFKKDIDADELGSPMYQTILDRLKPKHWFAAHYHVRFQTNYSHQPISRDSNSRDIERTHFLALDKCKFKRTYLEVINVQSDEFNTTGLEYDLEWLAILKATSEYVSIQEVPSKQIPQSHIFMNYDLETLKNEIKEKFNSNLKISKNFNVNLPINPDGSDIDPERMLNFTNEQTTTLCNLLEIIDPIKQIIDLMGGKIKNPERINISDEEEEVDWNERVERLKRDKMEKYSNVRPSSSGILITDENDKELTSENQIEINGVIYSIGNNGLEENNTTRENNIVNHTNGDGVSDANLSSQLESQENVTIRPIKSENHEVVVPNETRVDEPAFEPIVKIKGENIIPAGSCTFEPITEGEALGDVAEEICNNITDEIGNSITEEIGNNITDEINDNINKHVKREKESIDEPNNGSIDNESKKSEEPVEPCKKKIKGEPLFFIDTSGKD